jgi:hypothetical protein
MSQIRCLYRCRYCMFIPAWCHLPHGTEASDGSHENCSLSTYWHKKITSIHIARYANFKGCSLGRPGEGSLRIVAKLFVPFCCFVCVGRAVLTSNFTFSSPENIQLGAPVSQTDWLLFLCLKSGCFGFTCAKQEASR